MVGSRILIKDTAVDLGASFKFRGEYSIADECGVGEYCGSEDIGLKLNHAYEHEKKKNHLLIAVVRADHLNGPLDL